MLTERELAIRVRALLTDFVRPMEQAQAQVVTFAETTEAQFAKVEDATERLSRLWKATFEAFLGFEVLDQFKKLADTAQDAADAFDIAARSAQNFGKSFDSAGVEAFVNKLAQAAQGGGYAINDMRQAVQSFTSVGMDGAQSERALADAANLAAAKHISFAQAVQILVYAQTGHIDMLTRYGIVSREAAKNIKTVQEAFDAIEHATSGAAEERAKGLAGAFGKLGSAANALAVDLGQRLIPTFTAIANVARDAVNWFVNLPGPVKAAAEAFALIGTALGATALLLPAVVKAFALLKDGVAIAWATLEVFGGGAKLVYNLLGALLSPMRDLVAWLGLMRDAFAEGAIAEWAAEAPIGAIIAALALLGVGIYEIVEHWDQLGKAMSNFIGWAGTAWHEFTTNFLHDGTSLAMFMKGLMEAVTGQVGAGSALMTEALQISMPKTVAGFDSFAGKIADAFKQKMTDAVNWIKNELFPKLGDVAIPKPRMDGGLPGKAGTGHKGGKGKGSRAPHNPDGRGEADVYYDDSAPIDTVMQGMTERVDSLTRSLEEIRHQSAMAAAGGHMTPKTQAQFNDREAKVKEEIATIQEAIAQRKLEIAQFLYDGAQSKAHLAALTEAMKKFQTSVDNATVATDKRIEADAAEQTAKGGQGNNSMLEQLGAKAGIPFSPNGGLSWQAVLMQAIEQSKSFADIMSVVNDIMRVFSQVIDALRPVIDILLKVLLGVVGVFVDLWNAVASILRLFGIHIKQLQLITGTDFAPLVKFFHDIPTLNELATGKQTAPYENINDAQQNAANGINDTLKSPDLGGGILGALGEILGAIVALKLAFGLFGGGSGGILGGLFKNFSFGGTKGLPGLEAALGGIHLGAATLGSTLLAVGGGALLGDLTGKLFGGGSHSTNGAIGGAIGGGLGATLGMFGLAAGPLGALAGAALGSLLGGVFGHADNPAAQPDKYDPQRFTTFVGELLGNGSHGSGYAAQYNGSSDQIQQALGGQGMLPFIQGWISKNLSGPNAALAQQLAGAFGTSGGGQLSFGHDIGQESIVGGSLSGTYVTIHNAAADAIQQIMQTMTNAASNVAGKLSDGAQNIRASLSAAGNDLAGAVAQRGDACAAVNGANVGNAVGDALRKTMPELKNTLAPNSVTGQAAGDLIINYNHSGDNNGIQDVEEIGQGLAEGIVRGRMMRRYSLTRRL